MFKKMTAIAMALSILLCSGAWVSAAAPTDKSTPAYHSTDVIKARGILTIAVSGESSYNYIIPNDPEKYGDLAGTRDGNVPEMCRRIAEELGVKAQFVEYPNTQAQLDAVTTGEADLAADNFLINEERLTLYEMTDDFNLLVAAGDQIFLSTKPASGNRVRSEADLVHARIGATKGTVQVTNTQIQYPEATVVELADNQAILDALAAGQVDAGVFSLISSAFSGQIMQEIAAGTVAQTNYYVKIPDYKGMGLVLMKGNRDLCESINTVLYNLRESGWLNECRKTEELEAVERGIMSRSSMAAQNLPTGGSDCPALAFSDLDTSMWYHPYVDYAIKNGLMGGTGGGMFSPDGTLTRAEVITVLWRMEGEPKVSYAINFTDVAEGQWYTDVIRWAVREKIMEGLGNGTFAPNASITWEQLVVILYRYAVYKGYDVTAKGDPAALMDASKISSWADEAMEWACGARLIQYNGGNPTIPNGTTKRCEFAATAMRFLENIADQ